MRGLGGLGYRLNVAMWSQVHRDAWGGDGGGVEWRFLHTKTQRSCCLPSTVCIDLTGAVDVV